MRRYLGLIVAACFCTLAGVAHAGVIFMSTLSGNQEVPPNASTARGTAKLHLNDAQTRLEIEIQIVGLDLDGNQTPLDATDNVTGAHIHRAPKGANGSIVFGFISANHDLNGDLVIDPVAGTITSAWDLNEGNGTTLAAELANLFNNGLYINIHTQRIRGGEIRGQINVPEPATLGLMGLGLIALGLRRRVVR